MSGLRLRSRPGAPLRIQTPGSRLSGTQIVAARRPDGTLAVAAFHFDPAALLARHDAAAPRPGDFRSTVAQVEALTGLDFGSLLRDAPPLDLDDA